MLYFGSYIALTYIYIVLNDIRYHLSWAPKISVMPNSNSPLSGQADHIITLIPHLTITPEVIFRLDTLFEFMTPNDLREHLMAMYHSYIQHEHDCLPGDFSRVAEGMTTFFDFLKFAGEKFNGLNGVDADEVGEE